MKTGRPPKLTDLERAEVYDALENYIAMNLDPKVVGFVSMDPTALKYWVTKDNIHDWPEFSDLVKKAVAKQEWYLLEAGGTGRYNPTIAIFRLKQPQHGYTDKTVQEQQVTLMQPLMQLEKGSERKVIEGEVAEVSVDELLGDDN